MVLNKKMWKQYLAVLWGALLLALSVPGQLFENGSIVLGGVAIAPYLYALLSAPNRRTAARYGFLFGLVNSGITYYWLIFYRGFAVWAVGGVTLAHAVGYMILAMVIFHARHYHRAWRPFIIAMMWATIEYMKSIGYLAFPWGNSGLTATESLLLIQHIELTGPWTLNYMMALINAIVTETLLIRDAPRLPAHPSPLGTRLSWAARLPWVARLPRSTRLPLIARQIGVVVTMLVFALLFGIQRMQTRLPIVDAIPLLIVQQNTDAWEDGSEAALTTNITLSRAGFAEAQHTDEIAMPEMIIWSETSIALLYPENRERLEKWPPNDPLIPFIREHNTPLLSGAPYRGYDAEGNARIYNSALLIDSAAEVQEYYGKRQLVPFAEHIPFWQYQFMRTIYRKAIGLSSTWDKGVVDPILTLTRADGRELKFGAMVCFEDSFSYLGRDIARQGGDLIINLTNNAWSQRRSAQVQHLSTARLRTIETRRALVRSTNSGESVLINAYGEIEARLPSFEKSYLHLEAPIYDSGLTFYARTGNWLGEMQLWGSVVAWIFCFVAERRRRDYSLFFCLEEAALAPSPIL